MTDDKPKEFGVSSLAKFLGVNVRTVRRWMVLECIPLPTTDAQGERKWTPKQAREILKWKLMRGMGR